MNALADRIAAIDSRLDAAEKEILFLNQMKGDSMDESNSHQMQNQITAQGYQIATLQGKTASASTGA